MDYAWGPSHVSRLPAVRRLKGYVYRMQVCKCNRRYGPTPRVLSHRTRYNHISSVPYQPLLPTLLRIIFSGPIRRLLSRFSTTCSFGAPTHQSARSTAFRPRWCGRSPATRRNIQLCHGTIDSSNRQTRGWTGAGAALTCAVGVRRVCYGVLGWRCFGSLTLQPQLDLPPNPKLDIV